MTDLTADFNGLFKGREAPHTKPYELHLNDVGSFLREAYEIHAKIAELHHWLRANRKAYLSTAPQRKPRLPISTSSTDPHMTDSDRENIDINAKQMIRGLDSKIRCLSTAEKAYRDAQAAIIQKRFGSKFGVLGSWATGGIAVAKKPEHEQAEGNLAQLSQHKDSVLWLLTTKLESCCKTQQDMMTIRLNREVEKANSLLSTAKGVKIPLPGDKFTSPGLPPDDESSRKAGSGGNYDQQLSQEQIQVFEQGNRVMLEHFESATEKVQVTQESLLEIAELHNMLASNLETQSSYIDQLVQDSYNTADNVGGGNRELKKATRRPSVARYTFFMASGLCAFLIVWDLII